MPYCAKCGNTGILPSGDPCTCSYAHSGDLYAELEECVDIPAQYQGLQFNSALLPKSLDGSYALFMQTLYEQIITQRLQYHNYVICSPPSSGKTILAYACIEHLYRRGQEVYPVKDVLEIRKELDTEQRLYSTPYFYERIQPELSFQVYATIATLLDRRVRSGTSTIFLYNGTWENLIFADNRKLVAQLQGNGSYCTVDIKTWD